MRYLIPESAVEFSEEIKKSRFITYLQATSGIEQAKAFWQQLKQQHPNARHHCWAAVAGRPNDSQQLGFSDDGEPSGTAGKPMLNVLLGSGIGEISAVVVRYYGGIQLGTGGLVRAYGNGVQQALKLLNTLEKIERQAFALRCDYEQIKLVQQLVKQYQVEIIEQQFAQRIELRLAIDEEQFAEFSQALYNRSGGSLTLTAN
ncbi:MULTISPECIES: IMPACT family protein [Testudinibacter]|uniref:IMPACT family protein n=1 Tax=Testudinibacter aquarius TaxID=1524974 RepID=A0A4V2W2S4_9PAST|nr:MULTISPECIES: IMPACT family protein [Testudinibacter]TNH07835.1 IMPACT family protein [Pasteurellaceae bacterium Phil11]KAE9531039.1 IMPACT family protein [Testudinibacter aquarius]TCV89149.1 putative YigZ family protein [Testudinibacter aquarius]TNG90100.1 IMPACT family protein [Testudinibacter aquarius]TNH24625.1 IMPACT family protein [Testudinibacter sp. TR-2022]